MTANHIARWLLLMLLCLGICGMHTLGHVEGTHGSTMGTSAPHQSMTDGVIPPDHDSGADPSAVCVAVLTSLLLLLIGAVRVRRMHRARAHGGSANAGRPSARPPPLQISLLLTRVSVLRL